MPSVRWWQRHRWTVGFRDWSQQSLVRDYGEPLSWRISFVIGLRDGWVPQVLLAQLMLRIGIYLSPDTNPDIWWETGQVSSCAVNCIATSGHGTYIADSLFFLLISTSLSFGVNLFFYHNLIHDFSFIFFFLVLNMFKTMSLTGWKQNKIKLRDESCECVSCHLFSTIQYFAF